MPVILRTTNLLSRRAASALSYLAIPGYLCTLERQRVLAELSTGTPVHRRYFRRLAKPPPARPSPSEQARGYRQRCGDGARGGAMLQAQHRREQKTLRHMRPRASCALPSAYSIAAGPLPAASPVQSCVDTACSCCRRVWATKFSAIGHLQPVLAQVYCAYLCNGGLNDSMCGDGEGDGDGGRCCWCGGKQGLELQKSAFDKLYRCKSESAWGTFAPHLTPQLQLALSSPSPLRLFTFSSLP